MARDRAIFFIILQSLYTPKEIAAGKVDAVDLGMLAEYVNNATKTSGDIVDYLDGEIEWNDIPDEGMVTLVTPANAGYLRDTYGVYVSPGMVPRQMKAAFKAAREKELASDTFSRIAEAVSEAEITLYDTSGNMEVAGEIGYDSRIDNLLKDTLPIHKKVEDRRRQEAYKDMEKASGVTIVSKKLSNGEEGYMVDDTIVINEDIADTYQGIRFAIRSIMEYSGASNTYFIKQRLSDNGFGSAVDLQTRDSFEDLDEAEKSWYRNRNAFKAIPSRGYTEPMSKKHVKTVMREMGVSFGKAKIVLQNRKELVGSGLFGYTNPNKKEIQFYPDAFMSREELVKTIGHEKVHLTQLEKYGPTNDIHLGLIYEREARESEVQWWAEYRKESGYE